MEKRKHKKDKKAYDAILKMINKQDEYPPVIKVKGFYSQKILKMINKQDEYPPVIKVKGFYSQKEKQNE